MNAHLMAQQAHMLTQLAAANQLVTSQAVLGAVDRRDSASPPGGWQWGGGPGRQPGGGERSGRGCRLRGQRRTASWWQPPAPFLRKPVPLGFGDSQGKDSGHTAP